VQAFVVVIREVVVAGGVVDSAGAERRQGQDQEAQQEFAGTDGHFAYFFKKWSSDSTRFLNLVDLVRPPASVTISVMKKTPNIVQISPNVEPYKIRFFTQSQNLLI
jgi:hypothetical protein